METRNSQLNWLLIGILLITGCATISSTPDITIADEGVSFERIDSVIEELSDKYGASDVLVVVDIDNTLMTSGVDLGGDVWYQWQTGKLDIKPSDGQRVSCLFEDAIGLLYELGPMRLTDESLPVKLRRWQDRGSTVFALTSRSPRYRAATERELARLDLDFTQAPLAPEGESAPVLREMAEREWSYMQGIMMTTGMNKGTMLAKLLSRTGRRFAAIVFVDDTRRHVDDVSAAFETAGVREVRIFHFTQVEDQRRQAYGRVLTDQQAGKMASDWQALNETLNSIFPDRVLQSGCLGD